MQRAESSSRPEAPGGSPLTGEAGRRAILVLGMHRSGTSAVARVLGLCGAALPPETLHPNEHNETGYWEPRAVVGLHDEFLSANGSSFADVNALPVNWSRSELVSTYADRLGEVLEGAYGNASLWVVKDPRLCRLVPLWRVALGRLEVKPLAVIPVRNPLEVAASLARRDRLSSSRSLFLWLRHLLDAEAATRDMPRSFVAYEALLADWRGVVDRVGRELAVEWPRSADAAAPEIEAFLDAAHRHHSFSARDLAARTDVSPWVSAAYRWAEAAAGAERVSTAPLDEIREALGAADLLFPPLYAEWQQDRARLEETLLARPSTDAPDLEAERALASDGSEALRGELTNPRARIEELESQVERHEETLESVQARARTALESAAERHRLELESLRAQHRSEVEKTRTAQADLAEQRHRWLEARHELRSLQSSVSWRLAGPLRWAERRCAAIDHRLGLIFRRRGRRWRGPLRVWREQRLLRGSGLFDARWYLENNPDVATSGLKPLVHYLRFGAAEGRDPNPLFSSGWYLRRNPDVAASGLNPLLHYCLYGAVEGRAPGPGFDTAWYGARNPDVARTGLNPLAHYLRFGRAENRTPVPPR